MPETAFIYPGQGALRPDAVEAWREHEHARVIERVGEVADLDLLTAAADPDAGATTRIAQPALFAISMAAHAALRDAGHGPDVVAGHSLGEFTAVTAAGALSLEDGAAVVAERGRAFADACQANPGGMAALLRIEADDLDLPDEVEIANLNSPGQTVLAGPVEALDSLEDQVREQRGMLRRLDVEGAFHSAAMAPATERVAAVLDEVDLRDPDVPVVSGVTGEELTTADDVRRALIDGVRSPVRWVDVQRRLESRGVALLVEVGPGNVLSGLAKRTVPDLDRVSVSGPTDVDAVGRRLDDHDRQAQVNA